MDLPLELLVLVCMHLHSPQDLVRFGLVSKRWRAAAGDAQPWRRFLAQFGVAPTDALPPQKAFAQHAAEYGLALLAPYAAVAPKLAALRRALGIAAKPATETIHALFADQEAGHAKTLLSLDNRDMVDPSPAWTPVKSTCSETQKCLIMLYHLFARTNSRQLLEPSIGIFGTNRCYEDVYAMHLMPLLNVKELWIPTAHKSRQHQHQPQATADTRPIISLIRFAYCQQGEFLGLVTRGTLTNHVIRFARASSDLARMGPIPKNTIPYFDLGTFESWFGDFVDSVCGSKIRRIETVLGRGNRELRLPSIFLDEGGGTGVAVTNGIKVQVSSAFMLSMARVCYRITLTYLPGQCSFESVQLYSRKWAFRYLNGRIERVQGEGVIGYYPLLSESTPNFSYCSYSDGGRVMDPDSDDEDDEEDALDRDHDPLDPYAEGRSLLRNPVVSCEGSFTFIPGSIENPAGGGRPFEAAIPFIEFVRPQTMCL